MAGVDISLGLNCNVLVLNRHYMAVRIVGVCRAFSLLCRNIAEVVSVEQGAYTIRSPRQPNRNPMVHMRLGHTRYKSWKQFLDHAYWSVELK